MTATAVDTDTLTDLDFKPTIPCEGMGHDEHHVPRGDARWIQHATCPNCGAVPKIAVCEGGRQYRLLCERIICSRCSKASPLDEWGFKFDPIERNA